MKLPLPPLDVVVGLLKSAKHSAPSLFSLTCGLVGIRDFSSLCRNVYFPTDDVSPAMWAIVNAGLYNLFMEGVKHPVLRARLCPDEGEYVVSVSQDLADLVWHGKQSVGHVRSNMTGTLFTVFDVGVRADFNEAVFPVRQRTDRCVIKYKRNILGAVPREFQVIVPREPEPLLEEAPMGPAGSSFKFPVPAPRPPPIEGKHKGSARRSVMVLENKKPVWNDALGAYTLDFGEAVKLPSKKNFQLVDRDEPDGEVRLMFGKVRRNHFYIDFCAPLSPLTAFGIILSSFDKKRFVT